MCDLEHLALILSRFTPEQMDEFQSAAQQLLERIQSHSYPRKLQEAQKEAKE